MQRVLLTLTFIFTSIEAIALPFMIQKNLRIRHIENGKAIVKGNFVLKAGSIVDIPDEYIVRNSIGDIDIVATLLNWRTSDRRNGIYSMISRGKNLGEDAFFQLKVIKAAPGSVIPNDQNGFVALDYLARNRAIAVYNDPASGVRLGKPTIQNVTVPTPTPRPDRQADVPIPTPRPQQDSELPNLPVSASSPGTVSAGIPASPKKRQILNPDTSKSADDLRVLEKSNIPTPTPRPNYKKSDVAKTMAQVSDKLSGTTGSAGEVCPSGDCEVSLAGTDEEEKLACEQISKGNFPESLNQVRLTNDGQKALDASVAWIGRALRNPRTCSGSCHFPNKGMWSWLSGAQQNLKSFCKSIENCSHRCSTSNVIGSVTCSRNQRKRESECVSQCSPYMKLGSSQRNDHLKRLFTRISKDVEANNPSYAGKMKKAEIFENMDQRLLCLNKRRENVNLEPMDRNCSSTAIGIGQVLKGTFYYGLGLANKTQQTNCLNIKIKDLSSKCRGWDQYAFRKEIYSKYLDFTPKELYDRRTLDVELQARSTYATFLDKLRIRKFNLNNAYKSYFGKSDTRAVNKIETCVKTGR